MSDFRHATPLLEGLLALITSVTRDAIAIYENSGHIPSIHLTTTHPLDTEAVTSAMRRAIRTLEGACEQLCTTLAPPGHTLLNVCHKCPRDFISNLLIQWSAHSYAHCYGKSEARIPDLLAEIPRGLSVIELSGKTGIDARKLGKVLRALATRHCFREST